MIRSKDWECPQCGKMADQIPESASAPVESVDSFEHQDTLPVSGAISSISEAEVSLPEGTRIPETPRPATPPRDTASVDEARPVPTPTIPLPQMQIRQPIPPDAARQAPLWIDGLIVAGICILVTMLYRKIGNSSNLIETISL